MASAPRIHPLLTKEERPQPLARPQGQGEHGWL